MVIDSLSKIRNFNDKEFLEWFQQLDKFDWKTSSYLLCKYFSKFFNVWWDPRKFNWQYSDRLCLHCHEYFKIWWDPNKFDWQSSNYLNVFCQEYKDIWEKDYLYYKIKGDCK